MLRQMSHSRVPFASPKLPECKRGRHQEQMRDAAGTPRPVAREKLVYWNGFERTRSLWWYRDNRGAYSNALLEAHTAIRVGYLEVCDVKLYLRPDWPISHLR